MDRIIDTHVHVWDPAALRYDWLSGDLNRAFLPADIPRRPDGGTAMIFVEAGGFDGLAEAQWVAGLDWPELVGIVAQVDLSRGNAIAADLERIAAVDRVVGVRWNLEERAATAFESPELLDGLRLLAAAGLTFDACVRHHQLPALITLLSQVPELPVVLDHLGKPDASLAPSAEWLTNLSALAGLPNMRMKLSGVPPEVDGGRPIEPQAWPVLQAAFDAFGPARCMLGSDWPVSAVTPHRVDPPEWFELVFSALGASPDERAQVGWRTASEFYGVGADGA
ncbi:MAG: amidohydrolase family protein [Pseudolysinimonas sp.]